MSSFRMLQSFRKSFYLAPLALSLVVPAYAQRGEGFPTQALIAVDSKSTVTPEASTTTVKVDGRSTPAISVAHVLPSGAQVALLIDDGLRSSMGRELDTLRKFVQTLPNGTEVLIGYMQNGRVVADRGFTNNLEVAAQSLRIPLGSAGVSASPYFCLSDFVKHWPGAEPETAIAAQYAPAPGASPRKARFVLMITNGVDPYNGSTSPMNQNSPYVDAAVADAQRAGVPVYSIYFSDAGFRGGRASFSGQSYLQEMADGTGGQAYYLGTGNPVSTEPFLKEFSKAVVNTYVLTFEAPGDKKEVRLKVSSNTKGLKLRSASMVTPGSRFSATGQ